ncbi:MAG TPA: non-canonical purine NTP pyrophosphatase, RdgB/HAM1 family [Firmicutes bacterium]|nr:non-canonical purine NTP pyrophosphatase, RdgB/HAM1 family [Bacillota bacterium]
MDKKIVIATHNPNKVREFKEVLEPLGYQVYSDKDFKVKNEPVEDGKNYQENAYIKAHALCSLLNIPVISDDSGIEIDALGDAFPGIHSARWAASISSDYRIVDEHVLSLLEGKENRKARYHCSICFLESKDAKPLFFDGVCEGKIANKIGGMNGFGYDPIFIADEGNLCFGDISDEKKNAISHRGKAVRKLLVYLSNRR